MSPSRLSLVVLLLTTGFAVGQYTRINVPIGPHGSKGTLHLYLFDARRMALKVIAQGRPPQTTYKDLNAAMEAHDCEAGCNGGPVNRQGKSLGLVIADGKVLGQPAQGGDQAAGVFFLDGSQPRIKPAGAFFANGYVTPRQLVQSGPFLVENGKMAPALDDRRIARRTFVLTDGNNRWAIGYSPGTTVRKLARALAESTTFKEFNVATALNLGGGSSSGIWIKREYGPLYLPEVHPVRSFIGLVKR